jgi:hypothetical protein
LIYTPPVGFFFIPQWFYEIDTTVTNFSANGAAGFGVTSPTYSDYTPYANLNLGGLNVDTQTQVLNVDFAITGGGALSPYTIPLCTNDLPLYFSINSAVTADINIGTIIVGGLLVQL